MVVNFITEDSLKGLYRKEPFKEYILKKEERLTPGGRQYLLDKGIKILDVKSSEKKSPKIEENKEIKEDYKILKVSYKLKGIETLLFKETKVLVKSDIEVAQNVMNLGREISNIIQFLEEDTNLDEIKCVTCAGINSENFKENLKECFNITDIYIYLERGELVLNLNYILCNLKELQCEIEEIDIEKIKRARKNINSVTNRLSQIICKTLGGVKCQKEIKDLNTATN